MSNFYSYKLLIFIDKICETIYSKIPLHFCSFSWFNKGNPSYLGIFLFARSFVLISTPITNTT